MSYSSRNAVIFLVFILVVVFAVQPLRSWWVGEYIANRSFVSSVAWFAPTYALIWLFELLWSAIAGFLLALAFRNGRPVAPQRARQLRAHGDGTQQRSLGGGRCEGAIQPSIPRRFTGRARFHGVLRVEMGAGVVG